MPWAGDFPQTYKQRLKNWPASTSLRSSFSELAILFMTSCTFVMRRYTHCVSNIIIMWSPVKPTVFLRTGENIAAFMRYYRDTFPGASQTPLIGIAHYFVDRKVEGWVGASRWTRCRVDSCLLQRPKKDISDHARRCTTIKEHFIHASPHNIYARPPVKKRTKKL